MQFNLLAFIGIGMSWAGYMRAYARRENKHNLEIQREYLMDKKEGLWDDVRQIASLILFPGGYLVILFSSNNYVFNLIFIAVANFIIFPVINGILGGMSNGKELGKFFKKNGIK